jgi:hypothetical protein
MTLVEVMVAVALSSILLGVVISVTVSLQRWDSRFRSDRVRSDNLSELAEVLRSDIRGASAASVTEKDRIVLTFPDRREIRYELLPDGCLRNVTQSGNATDGKTSFMMGKDGSWQVERVESGRWPVIVVSLEGPAADDRSIHLPVLYVYASVGADAPNTRSFQKTDGSTSEP